MTVWVDNVKIPYRHMIMCHMWSDDIGELLQMADRIGVARKHLQQPPRAQWVHFDISRGARELAVRFGAVVTDRYGPLEFLATRDGDTRMLARIDRSRALARQEARTTAHDQPDLFDLSP